MSFAKAEQLLDLATMLRARRSGITLNDVENRFGCSRRTAQRMMRQLEARFPDIQSEMEEDGCKRWRMPTGGLKDFLSLHADELAALDFAIAHLARQSHPREARLIEVLKAKILALVPGPTEARIAPDHDALLEAQGFVARPGPRPMIVMSPPVAAGVLSGKGRCAARLTVTKAMPTPTAIFRNRI